MNIKILATVYLFYVSWAFLPQASGARECCCTELEHVDENFDQYYMNTATLMNNSDLYFHDNPMVNECGITKFDMTNIGPRKPRKWGWVTYIGDSLNRGVFYTLANQFRFLI